MSKPSLTAEAPLFSSTENLFSDTCVLVDDAIPAGAIDLVWRPGPGPVCRDAELLTIALVRRLLGRRAARPGSWPRSPATGRALVRRLPHQS